MSSRCMKPSRKNLYFLFLPLPSVWACLTKNSPLKWMENLNTSMSGLELKKILYICTANCHYNIYVQCSIMNAWKSSIQFVCLAKKLVIPQDYLGLDTMVGLQKFCPKIIGPFLLSTGKIRFNTPIKKSFSIKKS